MLSFYRRKNDVIGIMSHSGQRMEVVATENIEKTLGIKTYSILTLRVGSLYIIFWKIR